VSIDSMRRSFLLAPIAAIVVVGSVVWAAGAGCTWPDYVADNDLDGGATDTTTGDGPPADAPHDGITSNDVSYTFPDGRTCVGHDEDGDGIPDQCDNCPNVSNVVQGTGDIGSACAPSASFITSPTRLLFDPFHTFTAWKAFPSTTGYDAGVAGVSDDTGFFGEDKDNDSFLGGTLTDTEPGGNPPVFHFAVGTTGAGGSSATVTTILTIQQEATGGGSSGVVLRVTGDPERFYVCAVSSGGSFAAAHVLDTGCTGGPCAPVAFVYPDSGSTQSAMPKTVPHGLGDAIGVRASVTTGGGGTTMGTFECRVFDPTNPSTLQSSDPSFAIKVDVTTSRWLPTGEVGLYAQRSKAQFFSVDVLAGP
jgi:hypothetical protein